MIKVTILTGPFTGKTRVVQPGIKPENLLGEFVQMGYAWEVDYSQATQAETIEWFKHDFTCRVARALHAGRPVKFLDKTYTMKNPEDMQEFKDLMGKIDDAVGDSGRIISIERDDETGVIISTHGFQH